MPEPNRRLYPREGDGFHRLTRDAYCALSLYIDPKRQMDPDQMLNLERVPEAAREIARRLMREIEEWRQGR